MSHERIVAVGRIAALHDVFHSIVKSEGAP